MSRIPYALLTLTAVFGFPVAWVLNQIWRLTFGAFFQWLGNLSLHVPIPGAPDIDIRPFHGLLKFDSEVQGFLSGMVAASERAIVRLFHQTIAAFGGLAHELGALAQAVERRVASLIGATIPRLIRHGVADLWSLVRQVPGLVRRVEHLVGAVERKIKAGIASALAFAYRQLRHAGSYAQHIATNAYRMLKGFGLRLTRLEKRTAGAQLNAMVNSALASLGLGWLPSANVVLIGKWLIHLDYHAVWEFIKDAVTILTETDMCKLAAYNYDVAVYVFEPVMAELLGLTEWFCSHKGETLASGIVNRPGYEGEWAPSATPAITLPFTPTRLAPDVPLPRGVIRA